jgi:hypothetical protein
MKRFLFSVLVCLSALVGARGQTPNVTASGRAPVQPSTCPSGYAMGGVNPDGTVICSQVTSGGTESSGVCLT